jgi:hypothetical protein
MFCLASVLTVAAVSGTPLPGDEPGESIDTVLEQQLAQNPDDAAAWRLLGRARLKRGDWTGAMAALEQAVVRDRLSAAACFDLSQAATQLGQHDLAELALQRVLVLAPESDYATGAREALDALAASEGGVQQASYEVRTFDGSNLERLLTEPIEPRTRDWADDLHIRFDLGAQYNSNVALAPSSRELSADDLASFQGTASTTIRWYAIHEEHVRLGPTLDLDFNFNEGQFERFDLLSIRPGVFADGQWQAGRHRLRPRIAYTFDHDEFSGDTFGNQHTVAASLGSVWSAAHITTAYWSGERNDLVRDGPVPAISSQDGWSQTVGMLHDHVRRDHWLRHIRGGVDFQHVDADGRDFRYRGVSLYGQTVFVLTPELHLTLRGGWAHRDYPDFTRSPSRNTSIWRGGGELRRYFGHGVSAAIVAQFDDFDSKNERFEASRVLAGGVVSWEY